MSVQHLADCFLECCFSEKPAFWLLLSEEHAYFAAVPQGKRCIAS